MLETLYHAASKPTVYVTFLLGLAFQVTVFQLVITLFPRFWPTSARRSWILTSLSSFTMTIASIPFLFPLVAISSFADYPFLSTEFSTIISSYFVSYVIADMLLGITYYPDCMDLVTGWFHHSLYAILTLLIIGWEKEGIFLVAGIQELPTLILSIGYLYKPWRQDKIFGLSFFLTRIVFHFYPLTLYIYRAWPDQPAYWLVPLLVVPLHFYWFGKWIRQQVRQYRQAQEYEKLLAHWRDLESLRTSTDALWIHDDFGTNGGLQRFTSFDSL